MGTPMYVLACGEDAHAKAVAPTLLWIVLKRWLIALTDMPASVAMWLRLSRIT